MSRIAFATELALSGLQIRAVVRIQDHRAHRQHGEVSACFTTCLNTVRLSDTLTSQSVCRVLFRRGVRSQCVRQGAPLDTASTAFSSTWDFRLSGTPARELQYFPSAHPKNTVRKRLGISHVPHNPRLHRSGCHLPVAPHMGFETSEGRQQPSLFDTKRCSDDRGTTGPAAAMQDA